MIRKIPRKKCLLQYPKMPWSIPYREKYVFPKIYDEHVLTLLSKSAKTHAKNIAIALQILLQNMRYDKIIFLGDSTIPWLYRQSEYKPAKEGLDYLIANKLSKTFNGGLVVDTTDINPFLKHLYWLVRTNTVLAYVHGIDEGQHIIINVCQYGSIHFCTLDEETDKLFHRHLQSSGLQFREGGTCNSPWSKWGKIKGRTLLV